MESKIVSHEGGAGGLSSGLGLRVPRRWYPGDVREIDVSLDIDQSFALGHVSSAQRHRTKRSFVLLIPVTLHSVNKTNEQRLETT